MACDGCCAFQKGSSDPRCHGGRCRLHRRTSIPRSRLTQRQMPRKPRRSGGRFRHRRATLLLSRHTSDMAMATLLSNGLPSLAKSTKSEAHSKLCNILSGVEAAPNRSPSIKDLFGGYISRNFVGHFLIGFLVFRIPGCEVRLFLGHMPVPNSTSGPSVFPTVNSTSACSLNF